MSKLATLLIPVGSLLTLGSLVPQDVPREAAPADARSAVERGAYLVECLACSDCHTPWHVGPNGPEPNAALGLSGHPADLAVTAPPPPSGSWVVSVSATNTAWAGPWGVSFTANLTPDVETGIGSWTEETFVAAIRNGKHLGMGRDLLPPMPWFAYRNLTDEDLGAIFAYLMSRPAVSNRVPEPQAPRS